MTEKQTKDVFISILGLQDYEGTDGDSVELTTAGKLTRTARGYHLSYQESALTGMEGIQTNIEVSPNLVMLTRTGQVCSEMVFEKGVRHLSLYDTPFGSLEVGVAARSIHSTIGDRGGELEVNYSINIDHRLAGENSFSLKVREAKVTQ
ncbi:MAG: DUF1934 domain-containing protein [Clostridiales bacterium]|nr:DUF1934 domain-containing protein [Clostridiales bacterium]